MCSFFRLKILIFAYAGQNCQNTLPTSVHIFQYTWKIHATAPQYKLNYERWMDVREVEKYCKPECKYACFLEISYA